MTDRESAAQRHTPARKASRRQRALPVYITTATLFVGMFGFLSVRVAQGQDPALGAPTTAQVAAAPRAVIVRRVIVTRHVTVIKPAPAATPGPGTAAVSAPASSGYSAPAQTQAPAYTAPAPVYTAPAPAPAATKTS